MQFKIIALINDQTDGLERKHSGFPKLYNFFHCFLQHCQVYHERGNPEPTNYWLIQPQVCLEYFEINEAA